MSSGVHDPCRSQRTIAIIIVEPQGQWFEGEVIFGFCQGLSGRVKRRSLGLAIKNTRTLIAPERLNIETPKNVAADGTCI